ncbi:MAG: 2-C-methyl-D-erythritol 2,4-cyclodiphosphate synthase [Bacteroidetes bacterium]|nr:2-C-methyl-D-erythritol 2,4-cyclodiphosphate synthase [Bacteroidota bacterium]
MNQRIGFGFDVHQFAEGRPLVLGGVTIPFERGLSGHSDADVLLHAICDALLGAAALGDIGKHFPDTDPAYKGISSLTLLTHVGSLLRKHGYSIGNIDATLVMERPKIAPYSQTMRGNIADALQVSIDAVSVKATTNEGMGFIGTGQGAVAHAVAMIFSEGK